MLTVVNTRPVAATSYKPSWVTTSIVIPIILAVVFGLVFLSGPPIWWRKLLGDGFSGGCMPYLVYAQNRWDPYGAAVRQSPSVTAPKIGGFAPNEVIMVNGWVHAETVYPANTPPFNSDIWFHLANQQGWVSFAGVRGTLTTQDPTDLAPDGGTPAPTPSTCEGRFR